MSAEARLTKILAGLDPLRLATLGRRYQLLARQDGAYVTLSDGVEIAIPPILTPVVQVAEDRIALAKDARCIVSALARVARAVIAGAHDERRALLLAPLSTFECEAMRLTHRDAEQLAAVRVDFLVGTNGIARALEVNATIPAMQGYADAIANAFLCSVGEMLGSTNIEAAIAANGRNTDDLLGSLRAAYRKIDPSEGPRSIAIVARKGDSQGGELEHYVRRWTALGHRVQRTTPEQIRLENGRGTIDGVQPDLFYRHVFLRRVEQNSDFGQMLLAPTQHRIWNPPASHLELKGMLGVLSAASTDDDEAGRLDLHDDERETLHRRLPWTRLLLPGPTRGPLGEPIADLVAFTRANASSLVLKRSWDYGGRGVFLGTELGDQSSQARLRDLLGTDQVVSWSQLVDHIFRSNEAWVVQTLVDVQPRTLIRVDDAGPAPRSLFADLSAFTCLNVDAEIGGGAVRASGGRIVNIQGGGGLAPLLREEALALLV